jgi:hypothetical protein
VLDWSTALRFYVGGYNCHIQTPPEQIQQTDASSLIPLVNFCHQPFTVPKHDAIVEFPAVSRDSDNTHEIVKRMRMLICFAVEGVLVPKSFRAELLKKQTAFIQTAIAHPFKQMQETASRLLLAMLSNSLQSSAGMSEPAANFLQWVRGKMREMSIELLRDDQKQKDATADSDADSKDETKKPPHVSLSVGLLYMICHGLICPVHPDIVILPTLDELPFIAAGLVHKNEDLRALAGQAMRYVSCSRIRLPGFPGSMLQGNSTPESWRKALRFAWNGKCLPTGVDDPMIAVTDMYLQNMQEKFAFFFAAFSMSHYFLYVFHFLRQILTQAIRFNFEL